MQTPINTPKFTYIIPFRFQVDRILNLRRVVEWLGGFSNIEIIIVEQDSHSKIEYMNFKARHIFIKNDGPFNKNWALNVGLRRAQTDTIVFGDSDLIMHPEHFIASLEELKNYEFVNPYQSVIDLDQGESLSGLGDILNINRPGRGETDHQKVPICGGITMFRKDALYKIAGWSEMFWGWGAEDDFQSLKVKQFLNWRQMPYKCYHLWHNRLSPDMSLYQRNLQIYSRFVNSQKDELQKQINSEFGKIGLENKCS
jgi:predicted glycosyltransferase involved in capsule biosynthesis